jgi:hypothetical protein
MLVLFVNSFNLGNSDFIGFWAAGKQLVHHECPYDTTAVFRIEHNEGLTGTWPNVSLDMPAAFFLVLPLGFFGAKTGAVLWLSAFIFCLMVSVRLLWELHGKQDNGLHLLCYFFAPVYICMMAGQLGAFMLLGVVLFLYFHESRPFWAGASLLLCTVKPHLFVPFGIVMLVWILHRKAYRVLVGLAAALGASCALSYYFDPHAWSQYSSLVHNNPVILTAFIPTLSVVFRFAVDRDAIWLQYVPAAAASVWGLWYFWTRRATWSWLHHGALLLLVSELCAPHGWIFDEVIVLPAILAALYSAKNSRLLLILFPLMSAVVVIEFLNGAKPVSPYYLWTAPAWFIWCLLARAASRGPGVLPVRASLTASGRSSR